MRITLLLAPFLLAAACNPYDPDLGETPFRCGPDDSCPSGYECVDQVCQRPGADPGDDDQEPGPDASEFTCNDDSQVENPPNDDIEHATTTRIPSFQMTDSYGQLAICPDTDKDLFRFGVNVANVNVRATVTATLADGDLQLQILNNAGAVIANGTALTSTELQVVVNNLAISNYFVQVTGKNGSRNNYEIEIVTCTTGGSGCP